jgi:hypothetical protein
MPKRLSNVFPTFVSPPFELADIIMPLAIKRARKAVILHLAGDFLTNMPAYRARCLRELLEDGRLHMVTNLSIVRHVRRCQWLIIAKNRQNLQALVPSSKKALLTIAELEDGATLSLRHVK